MDEATRPDFTFSRSARKKMSCISVVSMALGLCGLGVSGLAQAQMQLLPGITTVAGDGTAGYTGDGGAAGSADLSAPNRITTDLAGNLYIADSGNNVVREVAFATGVITTVAGTGASGYSGDGTLAINATFRGPNGIAVDGAGNFYIADQGNHVVRKVAAATGIITTVAGTGAAGYTGDGGAATSAQLAQPDYVTLDGAGNLYIADGQNNCIREVNAATGIITTVAGTGTAGYNGDGVAATIAELNSPTAVVVNALGYIYIADSGNNRVRKVNSGGIISTIAGNGTSGYTGDGGAATAAEISYASGLALDNAGDIYLADSLNNVVREVNVGSGNIATVVGNGTAGFVGDNGPAVRAELHDVADVAINFNGNLSVADANNNVVRKVTLNESFAAAPSGVAGEVENFFLQTTSSETISSITAPLSQGGVAEFTVGAITGCTVNGTTSNASGTICTVPVTFAPGYPGQRNEPLQVITGSGNINFGLSGTGNAGLAAVTPGVISTVAGNGTAGYTGDGSVATSAELNYPNRAVVDGAGNLYIADYNANVVRKVNAVTGIVSTVAGTGVAGYAGDGGAASSAKLNAPNGLGIDWAGDIYVSDGGNCRIREVNAATGLISTVAGNGTCGYAGDGSPATSGEIQSPSGDIAFDGAGNFYFPEGANNVIRKVALSTGIMSTVAGNGSSGYTGDGGPATSAELAVPDGVAFDGSGNLYIADFGNHVVRKVTMATGIIATVAGNGTSGYTGDGSTATSAELSVPSGVAVDAAGNLYIADYSNNVLREVNGQTGLIITVAGNATAGYTGDGGAATGAEMRGTADVAIDGLGNLYLADVGNSVIRQVNVGQSKWGASTTAYGATSTQAFIISNIGNTSLTIPPPNSGNNPSASGAFAVDGSSSCPQLTAASSAQTLAAGAECIYMLDFNPNGVGGLTGTVVLTDNSLNSSGSTQTIYASGTGVAAGTSTTLSAAANPAQYGQGSVTATVAPTVGTATPLGSVRFSVDGSPVGSALTLSGGAATYQFSSLAVGSHIIGAVYTPSTADFTGSSSSNISQTVNAATLTASIVGNPTKTYNGTTAAVLAPGNFAVAGFAASDGATVMQSTGTYAAANAGSQTVTAALSAGNFTAAGSTNFSNYILPTTATGMGTIKQAGSNTVLSANTGSIHPGQSVTLTATVTSAAGTPTSSVQFFDGSTALGAATLSSGVATYTATLSAGGTHAITAVYGGDTDFAGSTSSAFDVSVAAQDFTFELATGAAGSQTVSPGATATYKLVAAPLYTAFPGTVTLSVTGLPAGATYTFSPATVAASSASTPATLTVQTSTTAKMDVPTVGRKLEPMVLAVMLLPLMGLRRLRRRGVKFAKHGMLALALLLSLASILGMQGCSSSNFKEGGSSTSQPQSYNLTATATSGATTHSVNLTLLVQ